MTQSPSPGVDEPCPTKHAPGHLSAVHSEVEAVQPEGADPPDTVGALHTEVAVLHAQVSELHSEVGDLHTEVGELHTENSDLHSEVGELHTEISDLHDEVIEFPAERQALQDQVDNLGQALDSSRGISAAVGIIMERLRLTQDDAFQVLVKTSQVRNVKLRRVADEIVETGSLPAGAHASKADPGGE